MKHILVTGGLGFIGSHTVVELQNSGYDVIIVDDLSNSKLDVLHNISEITGKIPKFYQSDLRVKSNITALFEENTIDGVIHFAAFKAIGESVENPLEYYDNNLGTLIFLLQEMRDRKVDHFIFSSSCMAYGIPESLPITESTPSTTAASPYANTKQIGEEIIKESCAAYRMNAITLRYFNPIGAHNTAKIGELPNGIPQNLVPFITQTAVGERELLSVYGNDYDTHDGTAIRDYIHVVDLAKAHVIALQRLLNKTNKTSFELFNIGTGKGSSVLDIITTFEKVLGKSLNYKIVDRRPGDITAIYADTTLANEELGWKAEHSLEDALASAWQWQLQCSGKTTKSQSF